MSSKLTTPFGTTEFPLGTMKTDPLAATATPHEFELWRRTMVVRVAGMAWIALIFKFYKEVVVRKQLERQYLRALELDEDPLERYDKGRPLTREDTERLPTQLRPAAMDDLESISSVRSTIVGRAAEYEDDHLVARHHVEGDEDPENAHWGSSQTAYQEEDYQDYQEERSAGSVNYRDVSRATSAAPSGRAPVSDHASVAGTREYASQAPSAVPSRKAPASDHASADTAVKLTARQRAQRHFDECVANALHSDDYIEQLVGEMLIQLPKAINTHFLARVSTVYALFESTDPVVSRDITRQMKERLTHERYMAYVKSANLAALLTSLRSVMLLGRMANMHPSITESLCLTTFLRSTVWNKDKASLAHYLERMDTAGEVYRMQMAAANGRDTGVPDQNLCSALMHSLQSDSKLHDFYESWVYQGAPYPKGGYGEL